MGRSTRRLLLTVLLASAPSAAMAQLHPAVEEATGLTEAGDFEAALDAFNQAEQRSDLGRDDYITLLLQRAMLHVGMGSTDALDLDMRRLASFAPDYELGRRFPPAVRRAFEAAQGETPARLSVAAEHEAGVGSVRISASVENDSAGLTQEVRVTASVSGGEAMVSSSGSLSLPATEGARVTYYAEAIGPGGAPLASHGSMQEPIAVELGRASVQDEELPDLSTVEDDGGSNAGLWIGLGVGAAAVAATVVAVVLITSSGKADTQLSVPGVEL